MFGGKVGKENQQVKCRRRCRVTPVTLVHFAVDNTPSLQVHGVQDYHRIVCDAVGIDQAWYQGAVTEQNSPPWTTPP